MVLFYFIFFLKKYRSHSNRYLSRLRPPTSDFHRYNVAIRSWAYIELLLSQHHSSLLINLDCVILQCEHNHMHPTSGSLSAATEHGKASDITWELLINPTRGQNIVEVFDAVIPIIAD